MSETVKVFPTSGSQSKSPQELERYYEVLAGVTMLAIQNTRKELSVLIESAKLDLEVTKQQILQDLNIFKSEVIRDVTNMQKELHEQQKETKNVFVTTNNLLNHKANNLMVQIGREFEEQIEERILRKCAIAIGALSVKVDDIKRANDSREKELQQYFNDASP